MGAWDATGEGAHEVYCAIWKGDDPLVPSVQDAIVDTRRIQVYGEAAYAAGREAGLAEAARIAREARPCCTRPMYCHGAVAAAIEAVRGKTP